MKPRLLVPALLIVAVTGGIALLTCGGTKVGVGRFEVAVSFDPPLPEGTRVEYALTREEWLPVLLEHDRHSELLFEQIRTPGDAPPHIIVPFTTRSSRCFGETRTEPYDTAVFLFMTAEGEEVLHPVRLPRGDGARELVVRVPQDAAAR
jgi:hypothetical protein